LNFVQSQGIPIGSSLEREVLFYSNWGSWFTRQE